MANVITTLRYLQKIVSHGLAVSAPVLMRESCVRRPHKLSDVIYPVIHPILFNIVAASTGDATFNNKRYKDVGLFHFVTRSPIVLLRWSSIGYYLDGD